MTNAKVQGGTIVRQYGTDTVVMRKVGEDLRRVFQGVLKALL